MALLHMDGVSHYTSLLHGRETANAEGTLHANVTSGGPYGEPYFDGVNSGSAQALHSWGDRNQTTARTKLFFQFHGRVFNTGTSSLAMFRIVDHVHKVYPHLEFTWVGGSTAGNLQVERGINTLLLGPSTLNNIFDDTWHYHQLMVKIHDTEGDIHWIVNGTTIFNSTGLDTANGGAGMTHFQRTGSGSNARQFDMANFLVMSTEGSRLNSFIGERRIIGMFPSGGTTDVDWTPSSAGSTNWELVNENPVSGTFHVRATSTGLTDRYELGNLSVKPTTMDAVAVKAHAVRDEWGPATFQTFVQVSTDVADSTTIYPANTGYFDTQIVEDDPSGGTGWAIEGIQNLSAGVKT